MDRIRATLRIRGRVQGVFFRHAAKLEANRLGVTGWIRNCSDGEVKATAEGPRERVGEFVAWCKIGPPYANVDEVEVQESAATGEFTAFRVEH
jgi:acylphosphatase